MEPVKFSSSESEKPPHTPFYPRSSNVLEPQRTFSSCFSHRGPSLHPFGSSYSCWSGTFSPSGILSTTTTFTPSRWRPSPGPASPPQASAHPRAPPARWPPHQMASVSSSTEDTLKWCVRVSALSAYMWNSGCSCCFWTQRVKKDVDKGSIHSDMFLLRREGKEGQGGSNASWGMLGC